jgi:hypothetical protein
MKAKGSYNPVTQSAAGEYSVGKEDYAEQRKNTAVGGGIVILILLVIAGIVFFFWREITGAIGNVGKSVTDNIPKLPDLSGVAPLPDLSGVVPNAVNTVTSGVEAVSSMTKEQYDQMLKTLGSGQLAVTKVIESTTTPNPTTVRLNLDESFNELPDIQKVLINLGEGIGQLVGVDIIQAGYNMRGAIGSASQVVPSNASQNVGTEYDNYIGA